MEAPPEDSTSDPRPTFGAFRRAVFRGLLLGVVFALATVAIAAVNGKFDSLWEYPLLAAVYFIVGFTATPISFVELYGATRPPSTRRDALVGAATGAVAWLTFLIALFELVYSASAIEGGFRKGLGEVTK